MKTTSEAPKPDKERAEIEYRAGKLSIREIARRHAVSEKTVRNWAKAGGWARDLSAKVDEAVRIELIKATVRTSAEPECGAETIPTKTEREIVETTAQAIAQVITGQRSTVKKTKSIVDDLLAELMAVNDNSDLLEQLRQSAMKDEECKPFLSMFKKVVSFPSRVDLAKKLVEAVKMLISAENEVWNLAPSRTAQPADDPDKDSQGDKKEFNGLPDHILALICKLPASKDIPAAIEGGKQDGSGITPVPGM